MRQGDQDTPRPGGAPTLEFRNVHAEYGSSIRLFADLSMEVTGGTLTVLKGRSGSGKSTALAIASGLLAPTAGTVCWGSEDLYQLDEAARTQIRRDHFGIVLQNGGLISSLTALENVLLPVLRRRATARDRKRAVEVLNELGIAHRADHPPARLSGGEIQRVAIARALYKNPQLLLMDEPTASLDRATATSVIELIQGLRNTNRGLLIASHDQSVIEAADIVIDVEHLQTTHSLTT